MQVSNKGREWWLLFTISVLAVACSTPGTKLFTKSSPHEAYTRKLKTAGLDSTTLGIRWSQAARRALEQPVRVTLPYQETGYLAAERPEATSWIFSIKRGQNIQVAVSLQPGVDIKLFTDVFSAAGSENKLLASAAADSLRLQYEAGSDGDYLVRLQPELLQSGSYTVVITHTSSLAFPVAGSSARIGSFWGNDRDRGARKHEGIDIFDKFRTPVVAAADGFVTSVNENNLGGKVIFMRPSGKNYTLYYAHLDSQIASTAQRVRTGDTLGLIGNTGNAKNTPSHLHFGIYTSGGAIDPLPFVDNRNRQPEAIAGTPGNLGQYMATSRSSELQAAPAGSRLEQLGSNVPLQVIAATGKHYKVRTGNHTIGFVLVSALKSITRTAATAKQQRLLLESTVDSAAEVRLLKPGESYKVIGRYHNYQLMEMGGTFGWVKD